MSDDKSAEVISFTRAADPHKEARKEARLKKAQRAFKSAINEKLRNDRIAARKNKGKSKGKRPKKK